MDDRIIKLGIQELHPTQREFVLAGLGRELGPDDVPEQHLWVAGRGAGKSLAAVARMFLFANYQPGCYSLVTEPTWQDIEDIFMRTWRKAIPRELWSWTAGQKQIVVHTDPPSYIDVRSRHTAHPDDLFRGPEYALVLHDELAKDGSDLVYNNSLGVCRDKSAKYRSVDAISTPKMGWFRRLSERETVQTYHCSTLANPYGGQALDTFLRANLSPEMASQELDAQWVAFAGRVFAGYVDALWPAGNRVDKTWNPDQPWQLWLDFGLRQAAWIVVQTHLVGGKQRDVIVAEHLLDTDDLGTLEGARRVAKWSKRPPAVIYYDPSGNTAEVADRSMGSRRALEMVWGSSPQYAYPSGWAKGKEIQIDVLRNQVRGLGDTRNLLVSASLLSDGKRCVHNDARPGTDSSHSGRGVLEVFRELTWDSAKTDASLRGNPLEHALDALCYGVICRHRPLGGVAERA